jgi:hypothetical protein
MKSLVQVSILPETLEPYTSPVARYTLMAFLMKQNWIALTKEETCSDIL